MVEFIQADAADVAPAAQSAPRRGSIETTRAVALCSAGLVELRSGERDAAASLASAAQLIAERTDDRASLARAPGVEGAAARPPNVARIEAAARLWREVGDPVAARR